MAEISRLKHNGHMTTFAIRDARHYDCGRMARMLRPDHEAALVRVGVNTHRELRATFDGSYYRKAFLIDGKLAGMGGAVGSILSPFAFVWVALTDRATRYPIQIIREARKHLAEIMVTKTELVTTVMLDDPAALRLATFLGFHVADQGLGAPAETRAGRRTLREFITSTPEMHLQLKGRPLVKMGYHAIGDDLPGLAN